MKVKYERRAYIHCSASEETGIRFLLLETLSTKVILEILPVSSEGISLPLLSRIQLPHTGIDTDSNLSRKKDSYK